MSGTESDSFWTIPAGFSHQPGELLPGELLQGAKSRGFLGGGGGGANRTFVPPLGTPKINIFFCALHV